MRRRREKRHIFGILVVVQCPLPGDWPKGAIDKMANRGEGRLRGKRSGEEKRGKGRMCKRMEQIKAPTFVIWQLAISKLSWPENWENVLGL
jgi:hypothetical protein